MAFLVPAILLLNVVHLIVLVKYHCQNTAMARVEFGVDLQML